MEERRTFSATPNAVLKLSILVTTLRIAFPHESSSFLWKMEKMFGFYLTKTHLTDCGVSQAGHSSLALDWLHAREDTRRHRDFVSFWQSRMRSILLN